MKKTVSVNIKGTNFLIEEDAYELLQDYIERLTKTLRNESGSKEIIEDVELRIAEICTSKLNESKTVIELEDIEEILNRLGDPSDYVDGEDYEESTAQHSQTNKTSGSEKRLYRDTENAILGGVCQGIANFFNIDVVIIRAIFVIILLFGGFGFPLYVILWIIIPKAKNTIDRLRMKGRPITVETVREEVENAAGRVKEGSKNLADKIRRDDTYQKSVSRGGRILTSILGVILLLWGFSWLISFLVLIVAGFRFIPVEGVNGLMSITDFSKLVLTDPGDITLAWTGVLLLALSAITLLILAGIMLIARLKNKWAKLSLVGLFITGLTGFFICLYLGMKIGRDFTMEGEVEKEIASVHTQELVIIPKTGKQMPDGGLTVSTKAGPVEITSYQSGGLMSVDEEDIHMDGIDFEYKKSSDSLFHIYRNFSARGETRKKGKKVAKNIVHGAALQGDTLVMSTGYRFPKTDKIRNQEVTIIIEIPKDGTVRFNDRMIKLETDEYNDPVDDPSYEEEGRLRGSGKYRHYY